MGPKLSRDPRALAIALVIFEALLRKRDLHPRIRSLSLGQAKELPTCPSLRSG
jgi:hypothetical protein